MNRSNKIFENNEFSLCRASPCKFPLFSLNIYNNFCKEDQLNDKKQPFCYDIDESLSLSKRFPEFPSIIAKSPKYTLSSLSLTSNLQKSVSNLNENSRNHENISDRSMKSLHNSTRKTIKLENDIKISLKKSTENLRSNEEDEEIKDPGSPCKKKNIKLPIHQRNIGNELISNLFNNEKKENLRKDNAKKIDLNKIHHKSLKSFSFNTLFLAKKFIGNIMKTSILRKINFLKEYHFKIINDLSYFPGGIIKKSRKSLCCFLNLENALEKLKENWFFSRLVKNLGKALHPTGFFRIVFDCLMMMNIILYIILIPILLSFKVNILEYYLKDDPILFLFCSASSVILFIIDIFLNFFTAYYEKGHLIKQPSQIIKHYLKKQFFKDLLSIIFILMLTFHRNAIESSILLKLFSFFYVFRLENLNIILHRIEEFLFLDDISYNILSFFKLIFRILLLSHIFACIWHHIGETQSAYGASWLTENGLISENWDVKYLESFYFVAVVSNTVGFGDIIPANNYEKSFCIIFIYLACGLFAYTINSVGLIMQNINKTKREFKRNINLLNGYLKQKKISYTLRVKIKNYLEHIWHEEKLQNLDETNNIINKLSNSLKEELFLHANGVFLRDQPLFNNNFSETTLRKLTKQMKEIKLNPGEIIYSQDEIKAPCLYIVRKGEIGLFLEIQKRDEEQTCVHVAKKGEIFGELSFFTDCPREISAKSLNFSSLFVIEFKDFKEIIQENEEDLETFAMIKDEIMLKNQYNKTFSKCHSCHENDHQLLNCPYFRLNIIKSRVVDRFNHSELQKRSPFQRKPLIKTKKRNSLILFHSLNGSIQKNIAFLRSKTKDSQEEIFSEESRGSNTKQSNREESEFMLEESSKKSKDFRIPRAKINGFAENEEPFDKAQSYSVYFPNNNVEKVMEEINSKRAKIIKKFNRDPMNIISPFVISTKEIASPSLKGRSPRRICQENLFFKVGEIKRKSVFKFQESNFSNLIKKNDMGIFNFFLKIFRGQKKIC